MFVFKKKLYKYPGRDVVRLQKVWNFHNHKIVL